MQKVNIKNYNFSADVIRALAIMGVIAVHTANVVYARLDFLGGVSWWFAIIINSLSRISIPLFIMLSGYFILSKEETFKVSLKRTFNRIIVPLLFWFVVYILWNNGSPTLSNFNIGIVHRIFSVDIFDLYFLAILMGLYAIAPFLRNFLQKASEVSKKNFMIFSLILGLVIFGLEYIFNQCSSANIFTYFVPYTGLFVAGYVLGNKTSSVSNLRLVAIYGIFLLLTIIPSYFYYLLLKSGHTLSIGTNCLSYYTDSYLSINVVLMSLCAFVLLMRIKLANLFTPLLRKIIYSIARASLGIYILHIFFLVVFDSKHGLYVHIAPAWLYVVVNWSSIFLISYLASVIVMKIPVLKRTLGETK